MGCPVIPFRQSGMAHDGGGERECPPEHPPLLCRRVAPAVQASRVLDMKGNGLAHLLDFYCSFKVG